MLTSRVLFFMVFLGSLLIIMVSFFCKCRKECKSEPFIVGGQAGDARTHVTTVVVTVTTIAPTPREGAAARDTLQIEVGRPQTQSDRRRAEAGRQARARQIQDLSQHVPIGPPRVEIVGEPLPTPEEQAAILQAIHPHIASYVDR
jgi:hypothetical protein